MSKRTASRWKRSRSPPPRKSCIESTRFGYAPRVMMMKVPFHPRNMSLAVALSAFAGCTIAPPQITLTSIRRADSTSSANEYELEFELVNTQGKAVELETWSYSVVAPDGSTYGGSWAALAVLPGDARKSLVVPGVSRSRKHRSTPARSWTSAFSKHVSGFCSHRGCAAREARGRSTERESIYSASAACTTYACRIGLRPFLSVNIAGARSLARGVASIPFLCTESGAGTRPFLVRSDVPREPDAARHSSQGART